jgi:hypothetical protein
LDQVGNEIRIPLSSSCNDHSTCIGPFIEGKAKMRRALASSLLGVLSVAASAETITLNPQPDYPYLGVSCGGIHKSTFVTGFDANGNIRGEVYAWTHCGGSGRGGGYQVTNYDSWHSILWDLQGAVIETLPYDGIAPDETLSQTDANGNTIHDVLLPGTPQYVGVLETSAVAPAMPAPMASAVSGGAQTSMPEMTANGSSGGGGGALTWPAVFALLAAGLIRLARQLKSDAPSPTSTPSSGYSSPIPADASLCL